MKKCNVSLADANYYPLLNELQIYKTIQGKWKRCNLYFRCWFEEKQKEKLLSKVDEIKPAIWDIEVPDYKVKDKEWLKSVVSRAFLPKYFPNYKSIYGLIVMHGSTIGNL